MIKRKPKPVKIKRKPIPKKKEKRTATNEQVVLFAEDCLNRILTPYQAAAEVMKKYHFERSAATRFVSRAIQNITVRVSKAQQEHTSDSYEFYRKMINDKTLRAVDRIRAREACDKLLGIQGSRSGKALTINDLRKAVADSLADALRILAASDEHTREVVEKKFSEIADLVDQKYGKIDTSDNDSAVPYKN
jgi:hypothetical protein